MGLDASVYQDDENEIRLCHVRIGNFAGVIELRQEIQKSGGEFPLIMEGVLFNAFHCGDEIAAVQIDQLKGELNRLPDGTPALNEFKAGLIKLCEIALQHKRPITF
jgi:hypothetical protein